MKIQTVKVEIEILFEDKDLVTATHMSIFDPCDSRPENLPNHVNHSFQTCYSQLEDKAAEKIYRDNQKRAQKEGEGHDKKRSGRTKG